MAQLRYRSAGLPFQVVGVAWAATLVGCGDVQPREPDLEVSASAPLSSPASKVALDPSRVTLNWRAGQMEIRGTLTKPVGAVPDTVWVWAYFVHPGVSPSGSWSDAPIAVVRPFARGHTASIVARGPFHWATNPDLPRNGYFARVSASAASAAAAQVPSGARQYSTSGAVRVASKG